MVLLIISSAISKGISTGVGAGILLVIGIGIASAVAIAAANAIASAVSGHEEDGDISIAYVTHRTSSSTLRSLRRTQSSSHRQQASEQGINDHGERDGSQSPPHCSAQSPPLTTSSNKKRQALKRTRSTRAGVAKSGASSDSRYMFPRILLTY